MLKVNLQINKRIEDQSKRLSEIQPVVDAIYQHLLEKIAKTIAEIDTQEVSFADFRLVGSVSEETSVSCRPSLDFVLFVESSLTEEETTWSTDEVLVSLVFNIIRDAVVGCSFKVHTKYFMHDCLVLPMTHCDSGLSVSIFPHITHRH